MDVILLLALLFQSPHAEGLGRTACQQIAAPNRVDDYLVGQAICVCVKLGMDIDDVARIFGSPTCTERNVRGWGKDACVGESFEYLRYGIYLYRSSKMDWSKDPGPRSEHLDGGIGP
jgi:hypothetical protein